MKTAKLSLLLVVLLFASCSTRDDSKRASSTISTGLSSIPIDKGFDEYISGYTSGVIPVNAPVEIRFNSAFISGIDKTRLSGLFEFEPSIKGRAEWKDDVTLLFRPQKLLEYGQAYSGKLILSRLGDVPKRFNQFPINFQTVRKDFQVTLNNLEYADDGEYYNLSGEVATSDFIEPAEVEKYIRARLDRKDLFIKWDHTTDDNVHGFTIVNIYQQEDPRELVVSWDGTGYGMKQKGSTVVNIPRKNDFSIQNINFVTGETQRIDIILSEPVDATQELEGIIWLNPAIEHTVQVSSNRISIFPSSTIQGKIYLNIEASLRNTKGIHLTGSRMESFEFATIKPGISLLGKGIIVPVSGNHIFSFKAVNLKAVDLKIIQLFENNLPYFLQSNDLNDRQFTKRFSRPVFMGKIDLITGNMPNNGQWNLYSIDLSDYVTVKPGTLYRVELGMRKSYSLYACIEDEGPGMYEEMLTRSEDQIQESWDDPDSYYNDFESSLYYDYAYNWRERDDPCKEAYYSPDRRVSRNIMASNIGLIAKKSESSDLFVYANDIATTNPVGDVVIDVFDLQMQLIATQTTGQEGSARIACQGKPFLIIARKGEDRNYLKLNDGSSLSLSSFDVSGLVPERGIKTFIYGERDVWRPGDSIFLSVMVRDLNNNLPAGHPVQFELINPLDQRIDNQVQVIPESRMIVFRTRTSDNAVTGNYNASFRIGGATFLKRVRVETIKPNRLKIDLKFPTEILGLSAGPDKGNLKAGWLNGAVARNLRTTVELLCRPMGTRFENYQQFVFDDPASDFTSASVKIFDGTIDETGSAEVEFPGKYPNSAGMLNAVFTTRVFEKGGDFSIIQSSYKYAPYTEFVGINFPGLSGKNRLLYTDAENEVRIVTVDPYGKPVETSVEVNIYRISYRWWWESDNENFANYISNKSYKPVITKSIKTINGEGSFTFRINRNDWGRYLFRATASSGHSTGKVILVDWPWEYGSKGTVDGATLLSVSTDKEKYNVGENIQLSFPAPENARAIITLENATGIVDEMRILAGKSNTVVNFKAKPEMAPGVYAYVTLIQPHAQTKNDMPVRLYGIVPVLVEDPDTRLYPQISMPDEVRSQQAMEIRISETTKKPMTYTLAIVDEGLLDITGFKTPDPWKYFYAREALGVKTWDIYDYVLGAYGGTLESLLAIGGDEALKDNSANKAKRFIPVVRFLGPFELDAGKTNTHRVTLPLYTGSVKTMVIAGKGRAFGIADKSVFVRDPLMVLATAPRVISPGEKVSLPVTAFVQSADISRVTITAEGNNLVSFGESKREVTFKETGDQDVEFVITAGGRTGKAEINITATGGNEKAVYRMELEIRSPNPPETRTEVKLLMPGERYDKTFLPFGMDGTRSAFLEYSMLPSINLKKRIEYLIGYPHGCSEQVTSAVFPQLWIRQLTDNENELAMKASSNVSAGIGVLLSRQMPGGGIALWPGSYQPDNWVTSYAGHFLLEAEKLGYNIPSGFKQRWISFQKRTAQSWRYEPGFRHSANDQAYRLFTLALAGSPERGAMNRMRESKDLPDLSRWLLAASFATTGRTEVALELIDTRNLETESFFQDYYYGSYLRDRAIILYTLTQLKMNEQALPLLKDICDRLSQETWYSTQSIAWGLFAYMKFAESLPLDNKSPGKLSFDFNGSGKDLSVSSKQTGSEKIDAREGNNMLLVQNTSENPMYITFTQKGIPLRSDIRKEDKGLIMNIDYFNMDMSPLDENNLQQGTDFMMVIKVKNNSFMSLENIALTTMVPSGWEIQNTRMFESVTGIKESAYDYRDFRDDRIYTYFGLGKDETKTFVIILNAAYKGEYYQPAVWSEAMYNSNVYSRIPGKSVYVTGQ